MAKKLILDGVGAIYARDMSGNLKLTSSKVNKVGLELSAPMDPIFAGDSPYPFHLTPKDRADKITIEAPQFSIDLFNVAQGATTPTAASQTLDEIENFVGAASYTLANAATAVVGSDELYFATDMAALTRVVGVPLAGQYSIAAGVITMNATDVGKKIIAVYKWTVTSGTKSYILTTTRTVPFKLVHRATLQDDDTGGTIPVQLTVWKCQALGSFQLSQARKAATASTVELTVMDPGKSTDNPDGHVIDFIIGAA